MNNKMTRLEKTAFILVLLMTLLQGFYGIFSYISPAAFATLRGTELFSASDKDWVNIYGSRTIFITLTLAYLLFTRNYATLKWCALFGVIMPITDGFLAYEAQAPFKVIAKHVATIVYVLIIYVTLKKLTDAKP